MNWTLDSTPSLEGKNIIVTGGNSGLGFEAVKMFAAKNANVIMASRSKERAEAAKELILNENSNAKVEIMILDLSSKKSIKSFVETYTKKYQTLDVLLNNAGVMTTPYTLTEDGIELQQGVNHFGHFYLTALLFKTLKDTPKSRIVNVSSIAHRFGKMDFDNLLYEKPKSYNKALAYSRSKLENLLFTYELARRVEEKGYDTKILVSHPGIAKTNLGRHLKGKNTKGTIGFFQKFFSHTAQQGALSLVAACLDPEAKSGDFYGPEKLGGAKGLPHKAKTNKKAKNIKLQQQLWDYSEKLMNIDFIV
jgi:NAD(P)-dependent dehydrogenase (short-subunit alcohol dehydrogenase family)